MFTVKLLPAVCVLAVVAGVLQGAQVRKGHPRIFATREQIPQLAERCRPGGPVAAEYAALKESIDAAISQGEAINGGGLPSLCIVYQVEKAWGHDTKKYVDYLVKGLWGTDGKGGGSPLKFARQWFPDGWGTVNQGFMGEKGTWFAWDAMAYDWFYDALTPRQRKLYGDLIGRWLHSFMGLKPEQPAEITLKWGNYVYNQTWAPCGGYAWGNYYGRDGVGSKTLVALAIAGEGTSYEESARQWLDSYATKVPAEFIPFIENMGGAMPNGPGHGGGAAQAIILSMAAWRSATGEDFFALFKEGGPREIAWWPLFGAMPHSDHWAHLNDTGAGMLHGISGFASRVGALLAGTYRQPQAQWLALNAAATPKQRGWPFVLWYDPQVKPLETSELPLAYHFKGSGQLYMRSDWRGPDATWAYFVAGPQFIGYQSEENGNFQIYKGGGLAMRGGTDRYSGIASPSMNTVLIYNPAEKVGRDGRNHGGTLPGVGSPLKPVERGTMIAYESRPEYTYACGDLTHAYSNAKVAGYTRQFLYLRSEPESFVVYDRVAATKAEFPKLWLLHVMNEPAIYAGDRPARKTGSGEGSVSFLKADRSISSTFTPENNPEKNGGGRFKSSGFGALMCRTLLPEQATITKRGGPGYDNWGNPFDPKDNRNFAPRGGEGSALIDRSWWRLEVAPTEKSRATEFLHVLVPVLMPKSDARTAQQLGPSDFPAVTEGARTKDTVSFRIEQGSKAWKVTLNRSGRPGGTVEYLRDGEVLDTWTLATGLKAEPETHRGAR